MCRDKMWQFSGDSVTVKECAAWCLKEPKCNSFSFMKGPDELFDENFSSCNFTEHVICPKLSPTPYAYYFTVNKDGVASEAVSETTEFIQV